MKRERERLPRRPMRALEWEDIDEEEIEKRDLEWADIDEEEMEKREK